MLHLHQSGIFKYLLIKPDNFKLLRTAFLVCYNLYSYSASQLNLHPISGGSLAKRKVRVCYFCSSCVVSRLWKNFSLFLPFFFFNRTRIPSKLRFCAIWLNGEQNKKIMFLRTLVLVKVAFPWLPSRMGGHFPCYSRRERGQNPFAFLMLSFCPYQLRNHLWCFTKTWCALGWVLYILKLSVLPLTLVAYIPLKNNFWSVIFIIKYLKALYVFSP